jgi:hypothetical protein
MVREDAGVSCDTPHKTNLPQILTQKKRPEPWVDIDADEASVDSLSSECSGGFFAGRLIARSQKQTDADLIPELSANKQGFGSFRFASNPSRIDAKRGDHFLRADFPVPIRCPSGLLPICRRIESLDRDATCDTRTLVTSERHVSSFY